MFAASQLQHPWFNPGLGLVSLQEFALSADAMLTDRPSLVNVNVCIGVKVCVWSPTMNLHCIRGECVH